MKAGIAANNISLIYCFYSTHQRSPILSMKALQECCVQASAELHAFTQMASAYAP